MTPYKLTGWVIRSAQGTYLTDDLFWFPHDRPEDAFVFSNDGLDYIREVSVGWDILPAEKAAAEYDPESGTVAILGDFHGPV